MAPRPDVSEERKAQIMDAATVVFTRKGFHGTRMDDVVREAGLSKGALYWYFRSKEELIIALLDSIFGRGLERMESRRGQDVPVREYLVGFMEGFLADLRAMRRFLPIIYEFYALAFRNKLVRKAMRRYLGTFLRAIEPAIRRGVERGELRPVDAHEAALAFGAQLEGTLLLWTYDPDSVRLEKQLRAGAEMILAGLDAAAAARGQGRRT